MDEVEQPQQQQKHGKCHDASQKQIVIARFLLAFHLAPHGRFEKLRSTEKWNARNDPLTTGVTPARVRPWWA
jgi:hypothetical protein